MPVDLPDFYRTVSRPVRRETVVRGSRFIADATPVNAESEATAVLARVHKEFHAATHHCWAWRIGIDAPLTRSSDDGEPSGTAGRPILAAIERLDLTNIVVVVTRYFGGVKLGAGGLARAYAGAARAALAEAAIERREITVEFEVTVPYDALPRVKSLVYADGIVIEERFDDAPRLRVRILRSGAQRLKDGISNAARGRAAFEDR